jgi:hypothetical protein
MDSGPVMSLIHALFTNASAAICRLRRVASIAAVRSGAHYSRLRPSSHGSVQRKVSLLSPTTHAVDALTNALEYLSITTGSPDHGLD